MKPRHLRRSFLHCILLLCFCAIAIPETADAHAFNYGVIETQLSADGTHVKLHTAIPAPLNADATTTEEKRLLIEQYFAGNVTVANKQEPCTFTLDSFDTSSTTQSVFDGMFECAAPVTSIQDLAIHSSIFNDLFLAFDHFVTVSIKGDSWIMAFSQGNQDYPATVEALLDNTAPAATAHGPSALAHDQLSVAGFDSFEKTFFAIFKQFALLGMFHIWTGYDHMLFLLCVILLLRSIKKILILVTSFTVAHSITLILAGLHIVTISPKLVEPLIALTILYMAVRNFILLKSTRDENGLPEGWVTTFGFGLVHGLGFAGALADVGIPSAFFVPALVIFNLGIEAGQLCVLLLIVPILFYIDSKKYRRPVLMALSVSIALLALYWVISRILSGTS